MPGDIGIAFVLRSGSAHIACMVRCTIRAARRWCTHHKPSTFCFILVASKLLLLLSSLSGAGVSAPCQRDVAPVAAGRVLQRRCQQRGLQHQGGLPEVRARGRCMGTSGQWESRAWLTGPASASHQAGLTSGKPAAVGSLAEASSAHSAVSAFQRLTHHCAVSNCCKTEDAVEWGLSRFRQLHRFELLVPAYLRTVQDTLLLPQCL